MAHTFLSLDTSLIPNETKANIPSYSQGYFSNDGNRLLIDGYNENRELVHPQETFDAWLQWSLDVKDIQKELIDSAIEYTKEEFDIEKLDVSSIWYTPPVEDHL